MVYWVITPFIPLSGTKVAKEYTNSIFRVESENPCFDHLAYDVAQPCRWVQSFSKRICPQSSGQNFISQTCSSGLSHDIVSQIAVNKVRQEYMASKYRVSLYINIVWFYRIGQCGLEMSTNGSQQTSVNILRGRDVDIPFVDKCKRAVADWQLYSEQGTRMT